MKIVTICSICLAWLIWIAILAATFLYQLYLKGDTESGHGLFEVFPLGLLLVPAAVSAAIRWLLIPRLSHPLIVLVLAVVGLAIADSISLYGIFLFGSHRLLFFFVGLMCIIQFIPIRLFHVSKS